MAWKFFNTGFHDGKFNMSFDVELVRQFQSEPIVRLYGWKPPAISIGYFQSLAEEVDLAACRTYGIDFVRRITGGGAVLHEDEITYSIHLPEKLNLTPAGILESYGKICGGVIKGLAKMGVTAVFVPLNDLVVNLNGGMKKISGNAQTRKQGVILQHGTILLNVDVEKMFSLLKVPNEKLKGKLIEDVKQRVTSLSHVLGKPVSFEDALTPLLQGFEEEFEGVIFTPGTVCPKESTRAMQLQKEKYASDSWNKKR